MQLPDKRYRKNETSLPGKESMQFLYKRILVRKIIDDLCTQNPVCRTFFQRVWKYRQIVDNIRIRSIQSDILFDVFELISIRLFTATDIQ